MEDTLQHWDEMMADINREMGELTANVRTIKEQFAEMRADFEKLKTDTSDIKQSFAEIKGGWKVVISLAALAGAGLSWLTTYFLGKH